MFKRVLGLGVVIIVGVALVSASGAAITKTQKVTKTDVSTRTAVIHYLRSIHVSAKHAVIQRGLRNYAGAHCPGRRWTCAGTRHTVVQIAKRGGENRFVCRSSKCVVVQFSGTAHGVYMAGRETASASAPAKSPDNTATCVKTGSGATTGGGQICTINQLGNGKNTAGIYENTNKVSGLVQSAQYNASITQKSSGSAANVACVTQNITLDASTANTNGKPTTANLQATQRVMITQDATGGGANSAQNAALSTGACNLSSTALTQSQNLSSTISATGNITQLENAAETGANVALQIDQNTNTPAATGPNAANFTQTMNQTAIANAVTGKTVTQTQSATEDQPAFSGIVGTLNQTSTGLSTANVVQSETQCEDAANIKNTAPLTQCAATNDGPGPTGIVLNQTQFGPVGIFGAPAKQSGRVPAVHKGYGESVQTSNPNDTFMISQTSTQNTDEGSSQSNVVQGDCQSSGSCTAGQTATVNNTPTSDGYTAGSIDALKIGCNGQACQATPPPAPDIQTTPDAQTESTSATFAWTEAATAGVTLKCSIDGGTTFSTCDSATSTSYTGLSHGPHTFVVKAVDNTASHNESDTDSFTWEIVPYLTFETTDDAAFAGWSGTPGSSPITLTTGSDYPGTFAQFTIHDFDGIAPGDLAEPTFTTDTYSGGAPRYEIDFSNGDYVFGYPSQAGFGADSWQLVCDGGCLSGGFMSWGDVQTAEGSATVTDALIDADFPANATYNVTDFMYDGYDLADFGN